MSETVTSVIIRVLPGFLTGGHRGFCLLSWAVLMEMEFRQQKTVSAVEIRKEEKEKGVKAYLDGHEKAHLR